MTIEERIERLERTNRRYRIMFTLIGVIVVCAVGISATQDDKVPDVIQAKRFEAVDNEGNVLVMIKANSFSADNPLSGSLIQMNTKTNKGLITMSIIDGLGKLAKPGELAGLGNDLPPMTMISLTNPELPGALFLAAGSLYIMSEDAEGKGIRLIELGIDQGAGSLKFFDGSVELEPPVTLRFDGKSGGLLTRGIVVVDDENRVRSTIMPGRIRMSNEEEKETVYLGVTAKGAGRITTYNGQGKELVSISGDEDGGALHVYNKTGESVCSLVVDEYGNGRIGAWDRNGKGRTLKPGP